MIEAQEKLYERFEKYLDAGLLFPHHNCSMCNKTVGYRKFNEQLYFDSNCNCVSYYTELRPVEKSEIDPMLSGKMGAWPEHFEKFLTKKGF